MENDDISGPRFLIDGKIFAVFEIRGERQEEEHQLWLLRVFNGGLWLLWC